MSYVYSYMYIQIYISSIFGRAQTKTKAVLKTKMCSAPRTPTKVHTSIVNSLPTSINHLLHPMWYTLNQASYCY